MHLGAILLEPLLPAADRQHPVAPHLQFVVEGFHGAVVEGVFRLLALARPDQRFVGIGKAGALEIGHGIGLAPHDVVEDPEAEILQRGPHAEDVVIGADHPQAAIGLEHAAGFGQPFAGEAVVGGEAVELVPIVGDGIDMAAIGAREIAAQLEVIGRIGKHHIDAGRGQRTHRRNAIAGDDLAQRQIAQVDSGGLDRARLGDAQLWSKHLFAGEKLNHDCR